MAKPITKTWQEALKLARDCKIIRRPLVQEDGARLLFLLEDPTGQKFVLSVKANAILVREGRLVALKEQHVIEALELEPADNWEDT